MSATTEAPPASAVDWTLPVARAVHALIDMACERPLTNPGPWVVSFRRDGSPAITYRASSAPADAVLISEPGWYKCIWGPFLVKLAGHLWQVLAEDLALLGVQVDVPGKDLLSALYWGPMPAEGEWRPNYSRPRASWCWPRMSRRALEARDAYLEALIESTGTVPALAWDVKPRHPDREERARRLTARTAAQTPAIAPASAPVAFTWTPGSFGKGFISATGRLYAWNTEHPSTGGRPQHSDQGKLVAALEGEDVAARGFELTGNEFPYLTPVVIAPDGTYTLDSADPFWRASKHLGAEHERTLTRLAERFPANAFSATHRQLRYVADPDAWVEHMFSHYPAPRTSAGASGLSPQARQRLRSGD